MNTAEILRAAAGIIRQNWTRFIREWDGAYCALGAISMVDSGEPFKDDPPAVAAAEVVARALALPAHETSYSPLASVAMWNNADDQTAENVAAGLEYAALLWEQERAVGAVDTVGEQVTSGPRA